jgi:hypothetical protein
LKLITSVVDASWIVRKTIGKPVPALIGNKLACHYRQTDDMIECTCDVNSSMAAKVSLLGAAQVPVPFRISYVHVTLNRVEILHFRLAPALLISAFCTSAGYCFGCQISMQGHRLRPCDPHRRKARGRATRKDHRGYKVISKSRFSCRFTTLAARIPNGCLVWCLFAHVSLLGTATLDLVLPFGTHTQLHCFCPQHVFT